MVIIFTAKMYLKNHLSWKGILMHEHILKLIGYNSDYQVLKNWMAVLMQHYGHHIIKDMYGEKYFSLKIIFVLKAG